MQRYRFKARSHDGALRKGIVEAQTTQSAAEVLRGQKLFIIELHEVNASGGGLTAMFSNKVKFDDVSNFTRQLSTMISAGLPLTDALSILQVQVPPALSKRISAILRSVEGGSTFADSLEDHREVFSKVYVALVRAGEAAGVLDTILARLADNLEKQREFRAKTKGAMIYPVIVLIGMFLVGTVMMVFVLPKLTAMYDDFGADLPVVTKILMSVSNFMASSWYLMIPLIFGVAYAIRAWRKTKSGALNYDRIILKLPIFGKIKSMVTMSEFARTLSLLASAGVSLVEALTIVQDVVDNEVIKQALVTVGKDVERGNSLAESLAKHEGFPMLVPQMVSVGEQTGKLDEVLNRVAGYFEVESEHAIKNLSTAMEPLIMALLGLGVGFMIVAVIVPIYNLTSAF